MEIERLQMLIASGILAGAAFSAIIGFVRRGVAIGLLCGLAAGTILLAATAPLWLPLLGITPTLS